MTGLEPRVPPPGPHGDDAASVARALGLAPSEVLDLATSLNPVAPDVRLLVAATLESIRRYPDAVESTRAMAEVLETDPAHLLLTNGGAEAISLVATELPVGDIHEPEFSLYRRHLERVEPGAPRWRSNPHNPTGRLARAEERAAVWDEAFYPLATGSWTRGDATAGAVVLGSLTKLFACPGLRLGYVLTEDESLLSRLAARQPRWSVSSPALAVLPRLLEIADLGRWRLETATLRGQLRDLLERFGLRADESDASFVLVRKAAGMRERLARLGVVVRDCASFGLEGAVRIAVPDDRGLERLEGALGALDAGTTPPSRARQSRRRVASGRTKGALLVCGTSSDAGKSQIVTGLCRALARQGVRVAPFKAQNMSLNSFATSSGHEIGRAQAVQAMAALVEPEVAMNPVLLKPATGSSSQVVVMGEPLADLDAVSYQATRKEALLPIVLAAYSELRERFDVVLCEGAGSPAEINLLEGDIVNLGFADAAGVPAILLGDIERGGVLASIAGTFGLLPDELARHLRAFAINKFRGDPALLAPGIESLEAITKRPCAGVIPYLDGLVLDAEDSLGLRGLLAARGQRAARQVLEVAVIGLPHLANFTDLDALASEPDVVVRMVEDPADLMGADLVLVPGSKATVADLGWMREHGLDQALVKAAGDSTGPVVLGVCAGYQMLGESIDDLFESRAGSVEGLGLLPVATKFTADKRVRPRRGRYLGIPISGYEIRQGEPKLLSTAGAAPLVELDDSFGAGPEGCVVDGGRVAGTSLHGLFESDRFRGEYLSEVAKRRSKEFELSATSFSDRREAQIDRLADAVELHLDMDLLLSLAGSARREP